ncbi:hypothetical protein LNP74_01675 [Klebsiella pneumoniae subsp. pneumoniae]|nr:hypothetical protein [Klebsiella pneumoniae subsp. pneumoniae]
MFGVLAEEPEQIEQSYASCQPAGLSRWCWMVKGRPWGYTSPDTRLTSI